MAVRSFKYRLRPNREQRGEFRNISGAVRAVYNVALEQRECHYRQFLNSTGKSVSFQSQCRELTALRNEFDWLSSAPCTVLQQSLKDLDKAYKNFFEGRGGYPKKRRKGLNESFRFHGREVRIERLNKSWSRVRLPKIGWVKFRHTRDLPENIRTATVTWDPLGWHISFACLIPDEDLAQERRNEAVGIDRGVKKTLAYSDTSFGDDGFECMPIQQLNVLLRKAKSHQRKLSRCVRGSKRYRKNKECLARVVAKAARIRKDFNHNCTRRIVEKYGTVVVENLKTGNMTRSAKGTVEEPGRNVRQKSGLNRAILNQAWHQFYEFLRYKLEAAGGELLRVPAQNTSRRCSECGFVSKESRKSQAVFECESCGHEANADINAAINILSAGTRPSGACS